MGFYLELAPTGAPGEFAEKEIPPVFWVLYFIAGFALLCMAGAAHLLLWDLAKSGSLFDRLLVGSILLAIPMYVAIGIKLAGIRKFIQLSQKQVSWGVRVFGKRFVKHAVPPSDIAEVSLYNRRPTPNLAASHHDDPQYLIRGHWRVGLKLKTGKEVVLDRHTEQEALFPLADALKGTLKND